MPTQRFHLGPWVVCPDLNEIQATDRRVHLEPKAMQLLVVLASRAGHVVSREELLASVWPDVFVADGAVFRVLSELRRALGDDARAPRYIQTIPRRGYRLVEPVVREDDVPRVIPDADVVARRPASGSGAGPSSPPRSRRVPTLAAVAVTAAIAVGLVAMGQRGPGGSGAPQQVPHAAIEPAAFAEGQVWEDRADCAAYARARQTYERVMADAPGFEPAALHLVDSYVASAVIGCVPAAEARARVAQILAAVPPATRSPQVARRRASSALWLAADREGARRQFDAIGDQADVSRAALLLSLGEVDHAIREAWRAWREAPAELGENFTLATVLLLAGRTDEAIARFESTLDLYPDFPPALSLVAVAYLERGDTARAVAAARRAAATTRPPLDRFSSIPALVLRRAGVLDDARHAAARWRVAAASADWVAPTARAIAALADGDRRGALEWMARARATGDPWLLLAPRDALLSDLLGGT